MSDIFFMRIKYTIVLTNLMDTPTHPHKKILDLLLCISKLIKSLYRCISLMY